MTDLERIVPDRVMTLQGRKRVIMVIAHPPAPKRPGCPIRPEMVAVELRTLLAGSRWYGVGRAWIGADLRMHVAGFDPRFEEIANWPKPEDV